MNAIPLLVVLSGVAAAVEINGKLAGEINEDHPAVSLPVSHSGNVYVSLLPLSSPSNAQLFPITRKLTFKDGELTPLAGAPGMTLIRWPGNVYAIDLEPGILPESPPYSFPFTIASLDWLEDVSATLFYENGLHLLLENSDEKLLLGQTISTGARNGTFLARTSSSGDALLFVRINEPDGERLLCVRESGGAFSVIFEECAQAFSISNSARITFVTRMDTHLRHEKRQSLEYSGGRFVPSSSEPAHRTRRPATHEEVVIAFIEAVLHGFEHEALGYLTSDLSESISFADIAEFMGEFERWARPLYGMPVDENCVFMGICARQGENLYSARMFKFELDDEMSINNFKEL